MGCTVLCQILFFSYLSFVSFLVYVLFYLADCLCHRAVAALFLQPFQASQNTISEQRQLGLDRLDIFILSLLLLVPVIRQNG